MTKRPLLIDCDPGVDDTFAILLAASRPEFEIVAINPVAGNVPLVHTTRNTLHLAGFLGLNCRVGVGACRPLVRTLKTAADIHGNNGLGGTEIKAEPVQQDSAYAWDVLYEEAKRANGQLEVIALGPLTNIATAILLYPDLPGLIKSLYIMGGSATEGNMNAYAEFNIWVDPDACSIVLKSGIPTTICGLDGIHSMHLTGQELSAIGQQCQKDLPFLSDIAKFMLGKDDGSNEFYICDLTTVACFINPSIAKTNHCYVSCETKSSLSAGQTLVDLYHLSPNEPNVQWITSVDKEGYTSLLDSMVAFYTK